MFFTNNAVIFPLYITPLLIVFVLSLSSQFDGPIARVLWVYRCPVCKLFIVHNPPGHISATHTIRIPSSFILPE